MTLPTSPPSSKPNIDRAHLEAAADWFARLRDGEADAEIQQAWQRWLHQHPDHQLAWEFLSAAGLRFELLQTAEDAETAANVLKRLQKQRLSRRQVVRGLAAISATGVLAWGSWRFTPLAEQLLAWQADERTRVGEIRQLALANVQLWLNTNSAVNTPRVAGHQQVELLRGEILIATQSPLGPPLEVITAQGKMRPLGTRFVVRRRAEHSLLAVYQGAVEVQTLGSGESQRVEAGQQLVFSKTHLGPLMAADPARQAWVRGLLLAENISLAALLEELSRYHWAYLSLAPELRDLRVLGGYPLEDPEQTLAMLEEILPIRIERPLPWWIRIEAAH